MTPVLDGFITVACAVLSWIVAGWVTVNIIKTKMEDMIRRIEVSERRIDKLYDDFNRLQIELARKGGD